MEVQIRTSDVHGYNTEMNRTVQYNFDEQIFDYSETDYPVPLKTFPLWEIIIKSYVYSMIIFVSLVGNLLIVIVVLRHKRMRTTTNFYIVNLAVADLMLSLLCAWVNLVGGLTDGWVLGTFFCKFSTFSQVTCLVASVLSFTLIAYDRFFGIVFALKAHMTNRKARTALMLIWTFSLAVASPVLVFRKHKVRMWKNHVESWCDDDWPVVKTFDSSTNQTMLSMPGRTYYYTFVSVVLYFYPMLAMTIAYSIIIRKLKLSTMPGERLDKGVAAQQKTKRKVIAMLAAILSVFGICWMPYQIILLYSEWRTNRESLPDWFFSLHFAAACMADSNSALNPIIYAGFNENFKQAAPYRSSIFRSEASYFPSFHREGSLKSVKKSYQMKPVGRGQHIEHDGHQVCATV